LSLIDSLPALIIARLIIGFTTGLNSAIVPLYVNESSPPEL
jgi:MFS family permease